MFLLICALIIYFFQKRAVTNFAYNTPLQDTNDNSNYVYPTITLLGIWSLYIGNVFVVRNIIAWIILFYSIKFIKSKSFIKFVSFVILAVLFHRSSLAFLPAYFIYHMKITKFISQTVASLRVHSHV